MKYGQFVIECENYLYWLNLFHYAYVRRVEKNRFPRKCGCAVCGRGFECKNLDQYLERPNICWGCSLENTVRVAAGTLYHLIGAIPQAERDRQEIYPGDFRTALIPLPPTSPLGWPILDEWRRQGLRFCGLTAPAATGRDSQGLRDYSEGTRLPNKFGEHEFTYRQKGGPIWSGRDSHVALWLFGQLRTPDEQWTLKRIGRYYKNSCWWSKKDKPRLFDKCEILSWQAGTLWKPGQVSIQFEPQDAKKLAAKERQEMFRVARSGGAVQKLGSPAKRHANLASTQAAYNERWPSYWNVGATKRVSDWDFAIRSPKRGIAGVGEIVREQGSLNIPHETMEVRNNMVANLERDFGDEAKAAA